MLLVFFERIFHFSFLIEADKSANKKKFISKFLQNREKNFFRQLLRLLHEVFIPTKGLD